MKNKRLVWILVMLILVVSSVAVTALTNPLREMTSKLGGLTGWGIVAVNAAIIAAVLYFGLNLIPKIRPTSKPAQLVMAAVVLVFAIMFAVHIRNTIGNKFIWSSAAFRGGFNYLFTESYTVKTSDGKVETVYGILNPANIWKFIGMALIISWLLITFLKVGQGKNYIDYALAIILAANAVHNGITVGWVLVMGRWIAVFILTIQFSKTFEGWGKIGSWIGGFIVAVILVNWIFAIIFPNAPVFFGGAGEKAAAEISKEVGGFSWGKVIVLGIVLLISASYSGFTGGIIQNIFRKIKGARKSTSNPSSGQQTNQEQNAAEVST